MFALIPKEYIRNSSGGANSATLADIIIVQAKALNRSFIVQQQGDTWVEKQLTLEELIKTVNEYKKSSQNRSILAQTVETQSILLAALHESSTQKLLTAKEHTTNELKTIAARLSAIEERIQERIPPNLESQQDEHDFLDQVQTTEANTSETVPGPSSRITFEEASSSGLANVTASLANDTILADFLRNSINRTNLSDTGIKDTVPKYFKDLTTLSTGFSYDELDRWLTLVELIRKKFKPPDDELIRDLYFRVKGAPYLLLKRLHEEDRFLSWSTFKSQLKNHIGAQSNEWKLNEQLRVLSMEKLGNNFEKYLTRFQGLVNRLPPMDESRKVNEFTKGLHPSMIAHVRCHTARKKELDEAICQARIAYDSYIRVTKPQQYSSSFSMNRNGREERTKPREFKKSFNPMPYSKFNNNNKYNGNTNNGQKKPIDGTQQGNSNSIKKQIVCYNCKKPGHKSKDCRSKRIEKVNQILEIDSESEFGDRDVMEQVNVVTYCRDDEDKIADLIEDETSLPFYEGFANDRKLRFAFDTGATISIISYTQVVKYGFHVNESSVKFKSADGRINRVTGVTDPLQIRIADTVVEMTLAIIKNDENDVLLGLDWFKAANAGIFPAQGVLQIDGRNINLTRRVKKKENEEEIIFEVEELEFEEETDFFEFDGRKIKTPEGLTKEQKAIFRSIIEEYADVFATSIADLGQCTVGEHVIRTIDTNPIYLPPYRVSQAEREFLRNEIAEMLKNNIIEPSVSEWSAPVIVVPKKDKSKRIAIDYRKLNAVTIAQQWPVPVQQEILDSMGKDTWFTTLDLMSGYWQIKMAEDSKEKTAFSTPDGHYQFKVVPFGLKNAPTDFNRIVRIVIGYCDYVKTYFDDFTVHSNTFENHVVHVRKVLEKIRKANLKLKPSKCDFFTRRAKVLGHVISNGTISMDEDKIKAIKERLPPKNVKQVQQFLGVCNYYRRFVKDYAKIALPITELLKSDTKFVWDERRQAAFEKLKEALVSYPILRQPDFERQFIIHTDASNYALGAILAQKDDTGSEYVCAYASRTLRGAEKHYGITEKECLSVVWAIKQFRIYVYGTKFLVVTDHSALMWLMKMKDPVARLARWAIYLQAFDFEIVHRKGLIHSNADTLSRPVLSLKVVEEDVSQEEDISVKSLDPYQDDALLHFLRHKKHISGVTKNQIKRINKLTDVYELNLDNLGREILWYKRPDGVKLIVPEEGIRDEIIKKAHLLGHFQTESTLKRIQEEYYWKKMVKDVKRVVEACEVCRKYERQVSVQHPAKMIKTPYVHYMVGMDLVLGFPESQDGYIGLLVITEYLTKYPYVKPIKSKTAKEISWLLWEYITMFGPPKVILSDNGTEFVNSIVDSMLRMVGVEHRVTSAYHPRTNGQTERLNATIVSSLRKHALEDRSNWNKWIPYVLLAYRTRVHSSTNFTPFELMFGRKMFGFEDYSVTKSFKDNNLEEAVYNRSLEIRKMFDVVHQKAITNIDVSKERQVKTQNKANRTSSIVLQPGAEVYISSVGLHDKLWEKYKGPFTIVRQTKSGNYLVKNVLGEEIADSFPRERLKPVSKIEREKYHRFEKILDHRVNDKGVTEYLVRWNSGLEPDSWEPAENFADPEWISKYWKNKKSSKVQEEKQSATMKSKKRGPGRPRKVLKVNNALLLAMIIVAWLISSSSGEVIEDNFHYCYEVKEIDESSKLVSLETDCDKYKAIDFGRVNLNFTTSLVGADFNMNNFSANEITIIQKLPYEVKGEGYECWKTVVKLHTSVNFFGARSVDEEHKVIKLQRSDCELMVLTKRCDNMDMTCDSTQRECVYDGTPTASFSWMSSSTQTGSICKFKKRPIVAKDDSTKLFGTNCVPSFPECHLPNSIIIWDIGIIDNCPYRKVITLSGFTLEPGQILYHREKQLAFKLALPTGKSRNKRNTRLKTASNMTVLRQIIQTTKKAVINSFKSKNVVLNETDSNKSNERSHLLSAIRKLKSEVVIKRVCSNDNGHAKLAVVNTIEGLLVSASKEAKELKPSEVEISTIHEIILAENDGRRYSELLEHNAARAKVCLNRLAFLRSISWLDNIFEFVPDQDETKSIVYVNNGVITFPKCYPINYVTIEDSEDKCVKDLPVSFIMSNRTLKGYMQHNKIIKSSTNTVECGKVKYFQIQNSNVVVKFDGKKHSILQANDFINIAKVSDTFWDQVNFPHLSDVFSEVDIAQELYQEPIINIKSNDFIIENQETHFNNVNLGISTYVQTIFTKTKKIIFISSFILIIIILIFIIFKYRRPIRSLKSMRITYKPVRQEANIEEVVQPSNSLAVQVRQPILANSTPNLNDVLRTAELLRRYNYI